MTGLQEGQFFQSRFVSAEHYSLKVNEFVGKISPTHRNSSAGPKNDGYHECVAHNTISVILTCKSWHYMRSVS